MWKATSKQIETAVAWWKCKLTGEKTFDLECEGEDAGPYDTSAAGSSLLSSMAADTKYEEHQVVLFEATLVKLLNNEQAHEDRSINLSTDYYPDHLLREALEAGGIRPQMWTLPSKTVMWLEEDGSVAVSCGLGAETKTILAADEGRG